MPHPLLHHATLRLFKAVYSPQQSDGAGSQESSIQTKKTDESSCDSFKPSLLRRTIPQGFIVDSKVAADENLIELIEQQFGLSGEQANAAFHKSWEKIRSASEAQLELEQLLHYFTTYGFQSIGAFDSSKVFIPSEALELPEFEGLTLTFIRGLSSKRLLKEIIQLGSGVALSEQSLADIMTIVKEMNYESGFLNQIGNHQLRAQLYDHYQMVPDDPVEYLRLLVFGVTESSLLIKNNDLIEQIKNAQPNQVKVLDQRLKMAPENLATIFHRFKPIILALKSISKNKTFFNRLRKNGEMDAPTVGRRLPELGDPTNQEPRIGLQRFSRAAAEEQRIPEDSVGSGIEVSFGK